MADIVIRGRGEDGGVGVCDVEWGEEGEKGETGLQERPLAEEIVDRVRL